MAQVQNDSAMQYGHLPMQDRRDNNLDTNGSTPFQTHQSLGQALGNHLSVAAPGYGRAPDSYRHLSTSPPGISQAAGPSQPHAQQAQNAHAPLTFSVNPGQASPVMKRKQVQEGVMQGTSVLKRRRDADDTDAFDIDGNAQGAKHWTDDEKSKLFHWLMGPGQDEHWNSLRATKNSCLRECATEVFGSKKTYQALKGCYERNFNLFKQIYAFESFHAHSGSGDISNNLPEAERIREYERRLQNARKAGCDVGNITARTIDHWHRIGWYNLFYQRWHGDPATTRPVQVRSSGPNAQSGGGGDDQDLDEDQALDFSDPGPISNGLNGLGTHASFINSQPVRDPSQIAPSPAPGMSVATQPAPMPPPIPVTGGGGDQSVVNINITQNMVSTYLQFLQVQTQTSKMKLEYMRRREEREEKESTQRRELERLKLDREHAAFEHQKKTTDTKQKADRAIELLGNPSADPAVKQAASDYLKKLFTLE